MENLRQWTTKCAGEPRWRPICLVAVLGTLMSVALTAPAGALANCGSVRDGSLDYHVNLTETEGVLKIGPNATASGVSGTESCLESPLFVGELNTVPASSFSYSLTSLKLPQNLPPFTATLTPSGSTTGRSQWEFQEEPAGIGIAFLTTPLALNLHFDEGHSCTLSLSPTLTTHKSGSFEGANLHIGEGGSILLGGFSGRVVANEFAVGSVDPSSTCPPGTAERINTTLGLPLAAGRSSFAGNFNLLGVPVGD